MTWLAVAAGGALGSLARHVINQFVQPPVLRFPIGIVLVNVAGCFIIGLLAGAMASTRLSLSQTGREFVFVGLLGGFTTFSAFGLDTFALARTSPGLAITNVAAQVGGGLAAVWIGYLIGAKSS
ncbi:MAG: CrcB family protein [Acidimicrobiia bacterium]|nr:CrcB family protein [Acidimicrobiia bacterium]